MFYVNAQPDNLYFRWQLQVQISNFRNLGIEDKLIIIVGYDNEQGIHPDTIKLSKFTVAKFHFYKDERTEEQKGYIPSIQFFLLKKFFAENETRFHKEGWMLIDSDVVFKEVPKIRNIKKSKKIFLSDTTSYLNSNYIKSKSHDLFDEMCRIVNIDTKLVEQNDIHSGGAQYMFGGEVMVTSPIWDKILRNSVELYRHMENTKTKYSPDFPIQSWTAGMWSMIWNFWALGYTAEVHLELAFSWPTNRIDDWDKHKIMHNAGVTHNDTHLFYKGRYIDSTPFDDNFEYVDKTFTSYKYVEEILKAKHLINDVS